MEFRVLGPLEVYDASGSQLQLPAGRERVLLVALLLRRGEVVSVDALVDALWGGRPPSTAAKAVQGYVSHLRRELGAESAELLVTQPPGYVLRVPEEQLDAARFERLAADGRRALEDGDFEATVLHLDSALALWRGPALAEFAFDDFAQREIQRLAERQIEVTEDRVEAQLQLGRHGGLVSELEALVAAHPLRERLRGQLMLALYHSGRQADALQVYKEGGRLSRELGLEPAPELKQLERAILEQDSSIAAPPRTPSTTERASRIPAGTVTQLPGGTVTFLFTDVEGSTRLLAELGAAAYADASEENRRLVRECIARHGGVEVDTQGDAFFVAFASAREAAAMAAELQAALGLGRIRLRIGLHTGEAQLTAEGYAGLDVHRAARICAAAHGGQVLLSQATRDLVDLEARDLGLHRLKDLDSRERLYQLGDGQFAPLRTLNQTNLPIAATRFLGRLRECSEVLALLTAEGTRLLTLTGPGGTGKTRLAVEVAGALVPEHEQGVWWVQLVGVRDPDLVLPTVAQVVGAKQDLAAHIADRHMLILLDNFEHVIEAAPDVSRLVGACPNLRCLVTSREGLNVGGEQVYAVPPLSEQDALLLFAERATRPEVLEADGTAVAEICRRLDCLPLAVELAAARTNILSPERLLERLESRLPLLTGGARDAPERHRTLAATIAWSHDLLAAEEQQLFARLAVCVGGATLEAAEAICDADLDSLQSLVARSLIRQSQDRFWMLQTIQEYARERLTESGETAELRRRHALHFLELAAQAGPELKDDRELAAIKRLGAEHANLSAAMDWAVETEPVPLTPEVLEALTDYWAVRGHVLEGVQRLERVIATDGVTPASRAKALQLAGRLGTYTGRLTHAVGLLEQSAEIWAGLGHPSERGRTLAVLGDALLKSDDERAESVLEEALQLFSESDDTIGRRNALHVLGEAAWRQGDLARARDFLEQSLELARRIGDRTFTGATLHHLGDVALAEGDLMRAEALYGESLALVWEAEARRLAAYCLAGLAATAAGSGRCERAARLWRAVEEAESSLGLKLPQAERALYAAKLGDLATDELPPPSLEDAIFEGLAGFAGREIAAAKGTA